MTRFDDLLQRVAILNAQLRTVEHQIGSEVRDILHRKSWAIVAELNSALNLGLDNTALDLTAEGDRLRIHFWSGVGGSIEAEVNIFIATGYKGLEHLVVKLFGNEIAARVGPIWGFGDEQELRNMFARTAQPGLWFIAGSLAQCRIYSRYLALQIKACEAGLLAPGDTPAVSRALQGGP